MSATSRSFGYDRTGVLVNSVIGDIMDGQISRGTLTSRAPVVLKARDVFISASIGVALSTPGKSSAEELLRNADVALVTRCDLPMKTWGEHVDRHEE